MSHAKINSNQRHDHIRKTIGYVDMIFYFIGVVSAGLAVVYFVYVSQTLRDLDGFITPYISFFMILCMLIAYAAVHIYAVHAKRNKDAYILRLVLLGMNMGTPPIFIFAIFLFIRWSKPEIKQYYYS